MLVLYSTRATSNFKDGRSGTEDVYVRQDNYDVLVSESPQPLLLSI